MTAITKTAKASGLIGAAAVALTLMIPPTFADAHPSKYKHRHYAHGTRAERCYGARKRSARTGTVVGAIGGALVGNAVSGGNKTPGTLLGAGVGAVVGHQVGKKNSRCR